MVKMSENNTPFKTKGATEILGELMEAVVSGTMPVTNEEFTFESGTSTYTLACGSPEISDGQLIEVNRIFGKQDDSFYEFLKNTDFTVDLSNNQITFINEPDDQTSFYVSYRYNQTVTTGITDVEEGSVTRVLLKSFSQQMASLYETARLIKASAYIGTAEGQDLDDLLELIGVTRNEATVSSGYVTFYRDGTNGNSVISSGSQVAARANNGNVVFETTEQVTILDGFSSVRAPIEALAVHAGKGSNIGPDRITSIIGSAGGATRVNNPQYYSDYEFETLISGKYTYSLTWTPRRIINSEGMVGNTSPPWAASDHGVVAVLGFRDADMDTTNWTTNNVTITEDDPESGQMKLSASTTASAYISQTFEGKCFEYPHVFARIRGTVDDEFAIEIEVNSSTKTVGMYEFPSESSSTQPTLNHNWTLYVGDIYRPVEPVISIFQNTGTYSPDTSPGSRYIVESGSDQDGWGTHINEIAEYDSGWNFTSAITDNIVKLTASTSGQTYYVWSGSSWATFSVSTATFNYVCKTINDQYLDFVGVGHVLEEVSAASLDNEDEVQVNYTAKTVGLWYEDQNNNFFEKYDGDDSDGTVDRLFIYYQWANNISGGGDEESDDALRIRARNALQVAAKGTKLAIQNAILEIDGISQCEVTDSNDDTTIPPGECYVYVLAQGFTVSPSLNEEIVAAIDDTRAAGIQVSVYSPEVRYVNFNLNIVYDDSLTDYMGEIGQTTLRNIVSSAIDDYFANASINQALYFSDLLGYLVRELRGVVAAYIDWDDATTPTTSDDDYDGSYAYSGTVVIDTPQRISGQKDDATIVVQRGNAVTPSSFTLIRKSEKQ